MATPADAQQPRARARDLGHAARDLKAVGDLWSPTVEPARRARAIEMGRGGARDAPALREVPACIEEHVRKGAAHLARRAQAAVVVAAVEHGTAAAAHPVHGAREPGADAHHAAGECFLAVRFDDQVRMVSLEGVVRDTEASALTRLGQGAPPLVDQRTAT
jgi:hypothetical protein